MVDRIPLRQWWVIGGVWEDTSWKKVLPGTAECHGPYATHREAEKQWRALSWAHVDNCHARFIVEEHDKPVIEMSPECRAVMEAMSLDLQEALSEALAGRPKKWTDLRQRDTVP